MADSKKAGSDISRTKEAYLLEGLLSPKDCAQCKYCCSCRRSSLWENVIFDDELFDRVSRDYPEAKFMVVLRGGRPARMLDFSGLYKTDDPEEEALCFFNRDGCVLGGEKPFECAIWPLRVMRKDDALVLGCCLDCPIFAGIETDRVRRFIREKRLDRMIFDYIAEHPEAVKPYRDNYRLIITEQDVSRCE